MKKWLTFSTLFLTLFLFSCKDDNISSYEPPTNYEDKLAGTWNLDKVIYDTEIPDFNGTGSTPVHGEGANVDGTIVLSQDPNKLTYDFRFTADLSGLSVPVNQSGGGSWTTTRDDTKLIVTDEQTGEELIFNVMVNEDKKQVYTTTVTQNVLNAITLEVDLHLEFSRP